MSKEFEYFQSHSEHDLLQARSRVQVEVVYAPYTAALSNDHLSFTILSSVYFVFMCDIILSHGSSD